MKLLKTLFITLSLVSIALATPYAETTKQPEVQVVTVFDVAVSYPVPVWQKSQDGSQESEHFSNQVGPNFIAEQIPKGETLENWSMRYVASGVHLPENSKLNIDSFISMSLTPFMRICGQENVSILKLSESPLDATVVIFCTSTPNGTPGSAYGADTGEITVMSLYKVHNTFVKVYHQWRGKSFAVNDNKTWPIRTQTLDQMMERFKAIDIYLAEKP